MNWQLVVVGLLVAAAAGYLLRQTWRTWSVRNHGCAGGCGCGGKPAATAGQAPLIAPAQLTLRRRPAVER